MIIPSSIQSFDFSGTTVEAVIPSIDWLQQQFEKKEIEAAPYWAQVWPAAKALCNLLGAEPQWVKDKTVLELAAGLGLPSLLAAQSAKKVTASDYIIEAVETMKRSVAHNHLQNMSCRLLDWNHLDKKTRTDVLLLSDINYDPADFGTLYTVLARFIENGTTILLSTPQRLMAKPFMERLLPFQQTAYHMEIVHHNETALIAVWVLGR